MATTADLVDSARVRNFVRGATLLGHQFQRAQITIDFANKTHDAPDGVMDRSSSGAHRLLAALESAGVLTAGSHSHRSDVRTLRYGSDAEKHAKLLRRTLNLTAATAPLFFAGLGSRRGAATIRNESPVSGAELAADTRAPASSGSSSSSKGGGGKAKERRGQFLGAACWRLAKASASSGPPLSKQACRALLASLPLSRQAAPLLYKTTFALLASVAAVPDDCALFAHVDFPRIGRIVLSNSSGGGSVAARVRTRGRRSFVAKARAALARDSRVYAVCVPPAHAASSAFARCDPVPPGASTGDGHDDCCVYRHAQRPVHFSMQAFVADARRFRRAWPYPTARATQLTEDMIELSHTDAHFAVFLRAAASPIVKRIARRQADLM